MRRFRSRKLLLAAGFLLLIALWLLYQRVPRIDIATRIPASAIGFLEVNDLATFAEHLAGSGAWKTLAPEYGLWDRWRYVGVIGKVMRRTGLGPREELILSRSQVAIVMTSIELRGEEVRPRVAFIIETHSRERELGSLIERRLPEFARRAFENPVAERSEYTGIPVSLFRTADSSRQMLSAQVGSQWIISNHPESIEACIDAALGRVPTMANNFYLANSRAIVQGNGEIFGFVSSDGATRLTSFAAALIGSRLFGASPLAEVLQSLLTDFSRVVSNGVAYGMSFTDGHAVERYAWLSNPQVVEQLRGAFRTGDVAMSLPKFAPSSLEGLTVVRVADPQQAFATLEAVISSRLGAAQSFIFHRFVLSAREALFGLKESESAAAAIGGEMGSINLGRGPGQTIWVFTVKDRSQLQLLTSRFLTQGGASVRVESINGHDLLISSEERRGAVSFLNEFLVFGSAESLRLLLEARKGMPVIAEARPYHLAQKPDSSAPVTGFSMVRAETGEFMEALATLLPNGRPPGNRERVLADLPLATSTLTFAEASLIFEKHSPFGSLPAIASTLSQKRD